MPSAPHRARAHDAAPTRSGVRRLAGAATLVTAGVVVTGLLSGGAAPTPPESTNVVRASLGSVTLPDVEELRKQRLSRTAGRVKLEPQPVGHRFATAGLALRTAPQGGGKESGWVKKGGRVAITGQVIGNWAEVLIDDQVRWADARRLAKTKPQPKPKPKPKPAPEPQRQSAAEPRKAAQPAAKSAPKPAPKPAPKQGGLSNAPCPDGSSIESGLTSAATAVYRAVCAAFPQPTTYGGYDAHGEHVDGRAIDIMVSGALGTQIAEWLRSNAGALGIRNVIYAQRIWSSERGGEGWRSMEDRGSATANHYDHVHVAVH